MGIGLAAEHGCYFQMDHGNASARGLWWLNDKDSVGSLLRFHHQHQLAVTNLHFGNDGVIDTVWLLFVYVVILH